MITLGRNPEGKLVQTELAEMKSALIGGVSGSGKSTLLQNIARDAVKEAQVIIIDLKRVSFLEFKEKCSVVTDKNEVPRLLQQVCDMIEHRYIEMEANNTDECPHPRILIIVDEMADLMPFLDKKERDQIHHILSLGRQANITMICATQSPSKQLIGASIIDQFQTRIGLRVSNRYASQVAIGESGCERLANYSAIYINPQGYKSEIRLISPKVDQTQFNLDRIEF